MLETKKIKDALEEMTEPRILKGTLVERKDPVQIGGIIFSKQGHTGSVIYIAVHKEIRLKQLIIITNE